MANKAAWITEAKARPFKIDDAPMPVPGPNEVVVRNRAVAVNPVDWAMQALGIIIPKYPFIEGSDMAGEIHAVGSSVKDFRVGDRVVAPNSPWPDVVPARAAFQLFSLATARVLTKLPDNVSYAEACVLPLAMCTAASALFQSDTLGLQSLPHLNPKPTGKVVLIWAGSTSVGTSAIQLVRAAGYDVATTAGSKHFEYLKSLGATYVFDYKKPDVVEDITNALEGADFAGALCAFMDDDGAAKCGEIASKLGGHKYVQTVRAPLMPLQENLPDDVQTSNGMSQPTPLLPFIM